MARNAAANNTSTATSKPRAVKPTENVGQAEPPKPEQPRERKQRAPRTIEGDLGGLHARYSKDLPKLIEDEERLTKQLAEVQSRRATITTKLHKIEEVMRDNPTLPGLSEFTPPGAPHGAIAAATAPVVEAPASTASGTVADGTYDPTRYVPPSDGPSPESTPGDLDPAAPIPLDSQPD